MNTQEITYLLELADRWISSDTGGRDALRLEASTQGAAFERAFDVMIRQLETQSGATILPPLPTAMREFALQASLEKALNESSPVVGAAIKRDAPAILISESELSEARQPGQHIGPYRLIKELGRGGMGVVWLAERADGQHSRQVALKMPLVENLNWLLAARFARERNILASLEHPSIARLYDAGIDEKTQPYIAIEYVQGQPITDYVKEKRLKPEATAQLFIRVIEAVAHAHTQLVIHRDIKPSNILVDAKGEPHLLDFGIAKLLDDEDSQTADATQLTRLSGRALTLDYASPEQVNNASLGTASDVYSLGIVLYELLTGRRPYNPKGSARRDLEQAILDQDPAKPSDQLLTANTGDSESGKSARRMRGDLDTVVLKALRKDPKQRYATAQAFADDLKRYLAYEPIAAQPDSEWYRIGRFVRRNRAAVGAASAVVLSLVVGLIGTLWQAARADEARLRAFDELSKVEATNSLMDQLLGTTSDRVLTTSVLLEQAEALADRQFVGNPKILASLRHDIARRWAAYGELPRAEALAIKALAAADSANVDPGRFGIQCFLATLESMRGENKSARIRLDAAIANATHTTEGQLAYCLQQRSFLNASEGKPDAALADAERAINSLGAPRPGQTDLWIALHEERANANAVSGRLADAIADFDFVLGEMRKLGKDEGTTVIVTMNNFGTALLKAGQVKRATEMLGAALAKARASGDNTVTDVPAQTNYARALTQSGRFDAAKPEFQNALTNATRLGSARFEGFVSLFSAQRACAAGELDSCESLLATSEAKLRTFLPAAHVSFAVAEEIRGDLLLARNQIDAARDAYERSVKAVASGPSSEAQRVAALCKLSKVALKRSDNESALKHALEAVRVARDFYRDFPSSEGLGKALLALGAAQAPSGKQADARLTFAEAVRVLDDAVGADAPDATEARRLIATLP